MFRRLFVNKKRISTRKRLFIAMFFLFIFMFGIINFIFYKSMDKIIQEQEDSNILRDYAMVENNLYISVDYLPNMIRDWAFWDYTYDYLMGDYPEFPEQYLNQRRYEAYTLDFITLLNSDGEALFEKFYDLKTKSFIDTPVELKGTYHKLGPKTTAHYLENVETYINNMEGCGVSGYIIREDKILYMSAYPVLRNDLSGPCAGTLIFGRVIPDETIASFSQSPEFNISLITKDEMEKEGDSKAYTQDGLSIIVTKNKNQISAEGELIDILGNKDLVLSISREQYLQNEGREFTLTIQEIVSIFFLLMLIIGAFMMQKIFIKPLARLARDVNNVSLDLLEFDTTEKYNNEELFILSEAVRNMVLRIKEDRDTIKKNNEDLYYNANFDSLTGLNNRISTSEALSTSIEIAKENTQFIGVYFVDLIKFKYINDTLGHTTGDKFIIAVADRMKQCLPYNPVIGRLNGDKFIIVPSIFREKYEVNLYADTIISIFKLPFLVNGIEMHISSSVGSSVYPTDGSDVDALFKNAEIAMYYAKKFSGNMHCRYEVELSSVLQRKLYIENKIREAVNDGCNQFQPYFQPKVSTKTGEIIGSEALIRWVTPEGIIGPDEFIPLAEETGLIVPISKFMLKTACKCNKVLLDRGLDSVVSVNISSQVLLNKDFLAMVKGATRDINSSRKHLDIEITESTLLEDIDKVKQILNTLREMNVSVSIDDFGTGYSSLSYLKMLPVDRIKIDRSFITGLDDSSEDRSIVNAIVAMAKSFNMLTTAEGVEEITHADYLKQINCSELQGYYLSKPIPFDKYIELYDNWDASSIFSKID